MSHRSGQLRRAGIRTRRRGSVIVVVVWALAVASLVTAALQLNSFRQATLGREALARVQARWAARAGVERMISILAYHTENPDTTDAYAMIRDLEDWSYDAFETGEYVIRHSQDGVDWAGPLDEHSKPNINLVDAGRLLNMPNMTYDIVDAISDWRDSDSEVRTQGAEAEFYGNRGFKYGPRNAAFRSIAELELVAGCWPEYVRGEDWNLNGRLDPNEDDGDLTWPPDNRDGFLDGGWSGLLTAYSAAGGVAGSGASKLQVQKATIEEIVERTGVSNDQAKALKQYASTENPRIENLLVQDLALLSAQGAQSGGGRGGGGRGGSSGGSSGGASGGGSSGGRSGSKSGSSGSSGASGQSNPLTLSTEQLKAVFKELTFEEAGSAGPGKINVNTVSATVLREVLNFNTKLADNIIAARDDRLEGFTSIIDLLDVSGMDSTILAGIASMLDTTSNVFSICSRGTAASSGLTVEMFVVVDRSTLPIRILEYREQ
jgi:type II secretory pathway component PulK